VLKLHVSYPPELICAIAPAQHIHHSICRMVEAAKSDEELKERLTAWALSVKTWNCPWYEYDVGTEVIVQLNVQAIRANFSVPLPSQSPPRPPEEILDAINALSQDMFNHIMYVADLAMTNKHLKQKLLRWAKTTTLRSRSWAKRWVAEELNVQL